MSEEKKNPEEAIEEQEEVETAPETEETAPAGEEPDELEKLQSELSAEHDRYLRVLAEYDNFRKRSARERESIYADVRADTLTKFLPVYDDLERALAQETGDEAYRKGVELIMAKFSQVLEDFGVKPIEALGQTFDPALHHAVMHEEDESRGEGEITQEFQRGFIMGDKVIRFSMVKTAN